MASCQRANGSSSLCFLLTPGAGATLWSSSPSIVPRDDDQDTYLVMDDFGGRLGLAWHETDPNDTDLDTVICDLLDGQYSNPVRVVGFNTAEGWSRDVTEDVAHELRRRCDLERRDLPESVREFVESHELDRRQLTLRLV